MCFPPCPPIHPQPHLHCFYCHFVFLEYLFPLSPYTFSDSPVFPFFGSAITSSRKSFGIFQTQTKPKLPSFQYGITLLLNPSSFAQCTVKPNTDTELGAEKGLLQSQEKTVGSLSSKSPTTLLGKRFYKQNLGGGLQGYVTFSLIGWWEVIGWWSRKLHHQPSSSNHSGIHVLLLSLKLPSSTWVGALISVSHCFVFLFGGTRTLLLPHTISWLPLLFFFSCSPSLL